jgi:transcription elongation factor GreA
MSNELIPMSWEGYEKLKVDLDRLQHAETKDMLKRLGNARDIGDKSDDGEYHAALEDLNMLQARINYLTDVLGRAFIMDRNRSSRDTVAIGTRVRVKDLDLGEEETFELVALGDEDYNYNKILTTSPIGQGLLGKKRGEVVYIQVPMGTLRFEIVEITVP